MAGSRQGLIRKVRYGGSEPAHSSPHKIRADSSELLRFWRVSQLGLLRAETNQSEGGIKPTADSASLKSSRLDSRGNTHELVSNIFVTALTDTMGFLVFLGLAALAIRASGL